MSRITSNQMRRSLLLLLLTLTVACDRHVARSDGPIELAAPGRTNANVTLSADGDLVAAAWAATGAAGTDVYAAFSTDGGRTFGPSRRVNDIDGDVTANGEQPPRIVIRGTAVDVLWVSKRAGVAAIRAATSADGGSTFRPARTITPAGLTGARGWESAAIGEDGTLHAVWLDGRNAAPHASGASSAPHTAGAHAMHHGDMRQDIYHAMWRPSIASAGADGTPVETPVASNVCFCCKTAIATWGRDVFIAWRHLFPGGVRDIAVARSGDGGRTFASPVRASEDNWQIDACPDDGPAIALDDEGALHLAWPTMVKDGGTPRMAIFEATSRDGGVTFSPRRRVDAATTSASHPRIAAGPGARTAIVWDELGGGARRVMIRMSEGVATAISDGRMAMYPAVAATRAGFVVAWTDQSADRAVVRALRLGELDGPADLQAAKRGKPD